MVRVKGILLNFDAFELLDALVPRMLQMTFINGVEKHNVAGK